MQEETQEDMMEKFETFTKSRPHVVILGAGASCAAIPNGDKNGRHISPMNNFIKNLGLMPILECVDIQTHSDNLEDIYMELDERSLSEKNCKYVKIKLENEIRKYISKYKIPDEPTIYDYLLLSLTSKDLVATFNWDPLLMQAYERVSKITENLPQLAFLHGNVAIGYCEKHNILGWNDFYCRCGKKLTPVDLLYPVKDKKYTSNPFITKEWDRLKCNMKYAYMLTIFGYSAPKSDIAAIELMKEAWGDNNKRNMEQVEIIDLRNEKDVKNSWNNFIHTNHYSYYNDFLKTTLGRFPRRSCEVLFDITQNCSRLTSNGFKEGMTFDEIEALLKPLLNDEQKKNRKLF